MLRALAALALASTTAQSPSTLTSGTPWWERVTVTVSDDGQARSCHYESSLSPNTGQDCSVVGDQASAAKAGAAKHD